MPTFQFFRNGTRCDEMRGADKNGLEEKIKKHYVEVELPADEQPKSAVEAAADGSGELRQRKPQQPKIVKITSDEQWKELLEQNRASSNAVRTVPVAPLLVAVFVKVHLVSWRCGTLAAALNSFD